jgi:RNA recognition motif-containing protein
MNIHVANLNVNLIESDLRRMFSTYGEVLSVLLVRDKINHRPRGTALIDMPVDKEAHKAILGLNGQQVNGKAIKVTEVEYNPALANYRFDPNRKIF